MEEGDFFKGSREYYLFNKENNSLKISKNNIHQSSISHFYSAFNVSV